MYSRLVRNAQLAILFSCVWNWHAAYGLELSDVVPANVKAYVQVGNLEHSSKVLHQFCQASALPLPPNIDVNLLAAASGLANQWELERGLGITIFEPSSQDIVVLVPVKDASQAVAKLSGQKHAEVYSVTFNGMPLWAKTLDGILALSVSKEAVAKVQPEEQSLTTVWTDAQLERLKSGTIFLHANIEQWQPLINHGIDVARARIPLFAQLSANQQMPASEMAEFLNLYLDAAQSATKQSQTLQLILELQSDSVRLLKLVQFQEDTELAKAFDIEEPSALNQLRKLPEMPYLFALGVDMRGFRSSLNAMFERVIEITRPDKEKEPTSPAASKDFFDNLQGFDVAMFVDPEKGMVARGHYHVTDAASMLEELRQFIVLGAAIPGNVNQQDVEQKQLMGKEVLEVKVTPANLPEAQQRGVQAVFKEESVWQYAATGESEIAFSGASETDPIVALLNSESEFTALPKTKQILDQLPDPAVGVAMIDPIAGLGVVNLLQQANDLPISVDVSKDAQEASHPVGIGVSKFESGMRADLFIHSSTIKSLVETLAPLMNR